MEAFHTVFRTWVTALKSVGLFTSLAQLWHTPCTSVLRDLTFSFGSLQESPEAEESRICILLRLGFEGYKCGADVWERMSLLNKTH